MNSDRDKTAIIDSDARATPRPRAGEQFAPGTMIANRFRIASILGSGGMGEVYRADDIKLDTPVALKFLPARLARDPILLARLHDEVRLGRQVTHPNVCRIYDIVDDGNAHFVAMEYVDGEDLSRLLKRIGRLAHDKAVDITRGIAAGLAAAHAKGILHRDLKPANVMVDSRGDARVMDFGLALAAGEDDGTISGTPAYMAPEQFQGQPATVQSDLYALGLVMYELFTGKRALNARTVPERMREMASEITMPSSVIRDIDPAVERIILRCLANDPAQRPASAREAIHSLPGGDPLAAALAAGETPSPRIVAAAGAEGRLQPWQAWSLLGAIAAMIAITLFAMRATSISNYSSLERSPEVLHQRAADILRTLNIPAEGTPVPQAYTPANLWAWLGRATNRWESVREGPAPLRYRLEYGVTPELSNLMPYVVGSPGWTTIEVDSQARLAYLLTVPATKVSPKPLDWKPLLDASGVDAGSLREVPPTHGPPAPFDARASWMATYPGDRTPVRAEAAAWQGTPVFFQITGTWDDQPTKPRVQFGGEGIEVFFNVLSMVVFAATGFLAWRNLRLRRGDRQGAFRVAVAFLVVSSIGALLTASGGGLSVTELQDAFGEATRRALLLFLMYIAFEPYVRRRWPELLISWSRLVSGNVRDPLIGRHVLIGVLAGVLHILAIVSQGIVGRWITGQEYGPSSGQYATIAESFARIFDGLTGGVQIGFTLTLLLVVLTILLRKRLFAGIALLIGMEFFFVLALGRTPELLPLFVLSAGVNTWVTVRYGLVGTAASYGTWVTLIGVPYVAASWGTPMLAIPFAGVAALAIVAFWISLGGQSPFAALDE